MEEKKTCYPPTLTKQVGEIIKHSQNWHMNTVVRPEPLLDSWYSNKKWFIDAIEKAGGTDYIYEMPGIVKVELTDDIKRNYLDNFIQDTNSLISAYRNITSLDDDERTCLIFFDYFLKELTVNSFFENKMLFNWRSDEYRNYWGCSPTFEHFVIPQGMKVIKAFKFFIKDKKLLEIIQNKASIAIQNNSLSGRLCFSVNPIDYLTISENNHNWRSCHALDGEYRSGNLSYISDNCTVVCYLKGDKDDNNCALERVPFKWNSKKWRVLLYIDPKQHLVFAGKQYPFSSDELLNKVKWFVGKFTGNEYSPWYNDYLQELKSETTNETFYFDSKYLHYKGKLLSLQKVVVDKNDLFYNDVLTSTVYTRPFYCYNTNTWSRHNTKDPIIEVGNDVKCLCCGKTNITSSESMLCEHCDVRWGNEFNNQVTECECCGCRILSSETYYDDYDNGPFCYECYEERN